MQLSNLILKKGLNIDGFEKSVVKEHTRRTKSGKLSTVKRYSNKKQKKEKLNPLTLLDKLEKETGLKVSMKIESVNSSMRGYATYIPKKMGYFDYSYVKRFEKEHPGTYPKETFATKESINFYFGNEVYNYKKIKSKKEKNKKKETKEIKGMKIPKFARNENYFLGYTTNYGRKKGMSSKVKSAGWGISPNVEYSFYELNKENIDRYASQLNKIYLGDGTLIDKESLLNRIKVI